MRFVTLARAALAGVTIRDRNQAAPGHPSTAAQQGQAPTGFGQQPPCHELLDGNPRSRHSAPRRGRFARAASSTVWRIRSPEAAKPALEGGPYNRPKPGNWIDVNSRQSPEIQALRQGETLLSPMGGLVPILAPSPAGCCATQGRTHAYFHHPAQVPTATPREGVRPAKHQLTNLATSYWRPCSAFRRAAV